MSIESRHKGLAELLKTTAHPVRLAILAVLAEGGVKCVKEVHELFDISQPNLSQHMTALREAGLVESEARGPLRCYYVLRPELVQKLLELDPAHHPPKPRTRESVLEQLDRSDCTDRKDKQVVRG